jgi:hypothetical protein
MKQYTTPEQTAKLIELGFEKPKSVTEISWQEIEKDNPIINANTIEYTRAYSIGELIEMLPENVAKRDEIPSTLNVSLMNGEWCVQYADFLGADFEFCNTELIDALYDMCVRLKERGAI